LLILGDVGRDPVDDVLLLAAEYLLDAIEDLTDPIRVIVDRNGTIHD
jgi:hypothetical protein